MILGAVDWTDDMHTGGSLFSRACIHGCSFSCAAESSIPGYGLWAGWCWLVDDADGVGDQIKKNMNSME